MDVPTPNYKSEESSFRYLSTRLSCSISNSIEMARCLALLALSLTLALADNANKVTFILNFLESQTKPTNLIVWRNCFDEREKVELIRNSFISTVFNKQDSLNESDFRENPQHWLFILDFTCTTDAERIIQKVNSFTLSFPLLALSISTYIDRRSALRTSISMDNVC